MVSFSNEAYATLASLKRSGESFSKVVMRITGHDKPRKSLLEFAGAWGTEGGERETQRIIDQIYSWRHASKPRKFNW